MEVKTIDVNAYEWFDKVNGNSYFSGRIIVNYGMESSHTLYMPFQYGYGSQYEWEAVNALYDAGIFKDAGDIEATRKRGGLYSECENRGIILRASKTSVLKRDCKRLGQPS